MNPTQYKDDRYEMILLPCTIDNISVFGFYLQKAITQHNACQSLPFTLVEGFTPWPMA